MNTMFKKIKLIFLIIIITISYNSSLVYANDPVYTQLRLVDKGTFNEFRYKITDAYFDLRNKYELDWNIDERSANIILDYSKQGYNYLPDTLKNKNYYNSLQTAVNRWIKYPNNPSNYKAIVSAIGDFLDKVDIQTIKWKVESFPDTWNAPLTVSLRWSVADPTWTKIPANNYTWWMYDTKWKRVVLGNGVSIWKVFTEEWKFSVFLDVSSAHKNEAWYRDVLPLDLVSSKVDITIKEKLASLIIKVNSINLWNKELIKFTPDEARYWLVFDATSSTPTSSANFLKTTWDFWNGVKRENIWWPKVERVIYATQWDFPVTLTLLTNEKKEVKRTFIASVRNPIATINSSSEEWFMWDKITFSAQTTNNKNLSYSWEIIDLDKDAVISRKTGTLFTYTFNEKWKYNVKMNVIEPSWESDTDTKIIYINSREPVANFVTSIPSPNKPNRIFFDATKSYDPDFSDDWKLKYSWTINWNRVELEQSNPNGSTWYFTFDSIWDHSVVLDVEDPDWLISQKQEKVKVNSILSLDFDIFPRVSQITNSIRFRSVSPEARFYEWDFWNGDKISWKEWTVSYKFEQSWTFKVTLKVIDSNDRENTFTKNVYIWDWDSPYSYISLLDQNKNDILYDETECSWEWAYILNRIDTVFFSWNESVNITGKNDRLSYSWKIWQNEYKNVWEFSKKFDELWCFPIKLTVTSNDNWKTHSSTTNVVIKNLKPTLSHIDLKIVNDETDPVIVNVSALWAKDLDWVIQSYLWYYYTDIDSEPQDFRITRSPSTNFVLPKITWKYYFDVVMKDNNEDRITWEQINAGSKYSISLIWDNLNTPLVRLSVNNSSVSVLDETIFTANVENILWQDLTGKVTYSWDFDWDWFYDRETTTNVTTYKYTTSWEKHAKVKVKYKWFSNTKTLTINVSNIIYPEFWYISIWNKFIFFDNSKGQVEWLEWNLWDWTIIKNSKNVVHEYKDGQASHLVTLKISEWTKVKDIKKRVTKNVKNIVLSRKSWLVVFTYPLLNDKDEIVLEEYWDNAFIYLWESKWNNINYVIDYDIDYDSDLNGWNDDDEDNLGSDSYIKGSVITVKLNDNKYQKVRVFIKDANNNVIDSKDITIVKNYVEEKLIDINNIIFDWVSDDIKLKIEKLKSLINQLPKEHKYKWLMYVQKLQEWWFDNREKTNVILDFEWFIFDLWISNSDEIINLLESLLVEDQADKSEKAITFNALKNLVPLSIVCKGTATWTTVNCYSDLIEKLEEIRDSENIEENITLWKYILDAIALDTVMTIKEKNDFKAILKTLIYWWVKYIPPEEKIIDDPVKTSKGDFMWLLINILKVLFYIIIWFSFIIVVYYIYYLVVNKDKNIWFQDFIIDKTSWVKRPKVYNKKIEPVLDIFDEDIEEKEEPKQEIPKKEEVQEKEEIPDWLKWSFSEEEPKQEIVKQEQPQKKEQPKQEIPKKEEVQEKEEIPDWLKWSFSEEEPKQEIVKQEEPKQEIPKKEEKTTIDKTEKNDIDTKKELFSNEDLEDLTKVEVGEIPDWIKESFSEEKNDQKSDNNIPDWLKTTFVDNVSKDDIQKEEYDELEIKTDKEIKTKNIDLLEEKPDIKVEDKKVTEIKTQKKQVSKAKDNIDKKTTKKEDIINNIIEEKDIKEVDELWDDWMTIPDWLKTDSDEQDEQVNNTK